MADDNKLIIQIDLSTDQAQAKFKEIIGGFKEAGNKAGDGFDQGIKSSNIASSLLNLKTLALGLTSYLSFETIKGFTSASLEAEGNLNRFNVALRQTGIYSKEFSEEFQKFASDLQKSTSYSDDAILESAGKIQFVAKLTGDELKKVTALSADLASALSIDFASAADMVAKALEGQTVSLSRQGIKVKEGANDQERFNNLMEALSSVSGTAEKSMGGANKVSALFYETMRDLSEKIGSIITQNPLFVATIKVLAESMIKSTESVSKFAEESRKLSNSLSFLSGVRNIIIGISATVEMMSNAFKLVFYTIETMWWGLLYKVIEPVLSRITPLLDAIGADGISAKLKTVTDDLKNGMDSYAKKMEETTIMDFSGTAQLDAYMEKIKDMTISTSEQVNATTQNAVIKNQEMFASLTGSLIDTEASMLASMEAAGLAYQREMQKWADISKQIAQIINNSISRSIVMSVDYMVRALINGSAKFKDFMKGLVGVWADAAIQTGAIMVMSGIGIKALTMLQGGAAIAAGLALIALGSIAKAFTSTSSDSSAVSSGGGVGGGYTPDVGSSVNDQPQEREKAANQVTVNISGSVYDTEETGMRIVDLINKNFQSTGSTIVSGAVA